MKVDINLDDLNKAGLAASLSVILNKSTISEQLEWEVVGPLIEEFQVGVSYQGEPELKIRKRKGEPEDPDLWSATIDASDNYILETGPTAIEAVAKAILSKLLPIDKIPLPSTNIARYLNNEHPLVEAILDGSPSHIVRQDPNNVDLYCVTSPDLGNCEDSLEHIMELATLVKSFNIESIEYSVVNGVKLVSSFKIKHY